MDTLRAFIFGCACVLLQQCPNGASEVIQRIIDGRNAIRGQFPYMVSIQIKQKHYCGAAIVSPTWLASAVHCYYNNPAQFVAVAGLLEQGEHYQEVQNIPIRKIVFHPNYDRKFQLNDIALLKLKSPLTFGKTVKPVKLPHSKTPYNGEAIVTGWGYTSIDPLVIPGTLQYLEMDLITNKECNKILATHPANTGYPLQLRSDKVCALPRKVGQSSCQHDSGGPLVQQNVLLGIVHGGDSMCETELRVRYPVIFTKVSSFTDFIKQYVKDFT